MTGSTTTTRTTTTTRQPPPLSFCNDHSSNASRSSRRSEFEKHYWADDLNPISKGSSTTVSLCIRLKDRSRLAVKTVKKNKVEHCSQWINEIEMLQQLHDHPNINSLKDVYEDQRCVHLVSDLCSGGHLSSYVQSSILNNPAVDYPQHEAEAACIIRQILRAIDYCHKQNIVHRDLKLDNVLFKRHKSLEIRVVDFDISCKHSSLEPMTEAVGTRVYMAPEVFGRSYDKKCDVWSIGVMAHALLSGELPFSGKDDEELIYKIQNEPLTWEAPCWEDISEEAKDFIALCLEKDPSKRPSAEELLANDWMGVAATSLKRRSHSKRRPLLPILSKIMTFVEEKFVIRVPSGKTVAPNIEIPNDSTSRMVQLQ